MDALLDYKTLVQQCVAVGNDMRADIINRHKSAGEYATGKTSGMLEIRETESGFQLVGWKYTGTYDEGRKPSGWGSGGSGSTDFSDSLLKWAEAKHITFKSQNQARGWAYCVMRKICQQGTQRYRQHVDVIATPMEVCIKRVGEINALWWEAQIKRTIFRKDLTA